MVTALTLDGKCKSVFSFLIWSPTVDSSYTFYLEFAIQTNNKKSYPKITPATKSKTGQRKVKKMVQHPHKDWTCILLATWPNTNQVRCSCMVTRQVAPFFFILAIKDNKKLYLQPDLSLSGRVWKTKQWPGFASSEQSLQLHVKALTSSIVGVGSSILFSYILYLFSFPLMLT